MASTETILQPVAILEHRASQSEVELEPLCEMLIEILSVTGGDEVCILS